MSVSAFPELVSDEGGAYWIARDPDAPRNAARWAAAREVEGVTGTDFGGYAPRVLARWMRPDPETCPDPDLYGPGGWWTECPRDHPAAVPVWRVE